ncbi:MAG: leucine-rich repeat protein, partial [Treponema sp.]|nr:leucine-rich repeat protein [Treponema sp.]
TYNLNGGTNPSENLASYTDGTTVTLADPERLGCDFAGWYEAEDFSGDAVTQLSGRSATLWAKWTLIEYSVTYIITNGSDDMQSASTMSGTYTVESELMAAPQKDGYSFKGWFLDSAQTQAVASFSGLTGAQTLYGHWAGTLYRVAYSGIDGATLAQNSAIAAEGFTTEDQTLALPTYEKRHYIFGGWIKEGGSQVTELSASSAEAGSTLTLCAKWTEVEYAVNFDLLFPSEVTNPNTAATITASTSPQALQDPIYTDNNFVFAGWYKDYQNGTYSNKITEVSVDDVAEPQSRLTLHAKWTRATPWTPSGATVRVTSMQTAADDIASLTAEEEFYLIVTDTNIESRQFKPVNAALKANANVKLYFDFSAAMTKFEFEKVLTTANCSFYSCENLSGITLPECSSFTEITENVFRGCKSLRTITLPKQITTIGNYVFRDCSSLETCVLQQNLSEIGYCAFENCSSLKEIDIPMSVRVWDSAFENCVNLETIYLARGVKFENQYNNIQKNIFKNCIKLKNVFFKSTLNYLGNLWGEGNWYGPAFYADFVYVYKDNSGSELEKAYYIRYSRAEESTQYYKPRWFTETNIPSSLAKNYAIKKGYRPTIEDLNENKSLGKFIEICNCFNIEDIIKY